MPHFPMGCRNVLFRYVETSPDAGPAWSDLTLVTDNVREFSRVPGLALENWLGTTEGCQYLHQRRFEARQQSRPDFGPGPNWEGHWIPARSVRE